MNQDAAFTLLDYARRMINDADAAFDKKTAGNDSATVSAVLRQAAWSVQASVPKELAVEYLRLKMFS